MNEENLLYESINLLYTQELEKRIDKALKLIHLLEPSEELDEIERTLKGE